MANSKRILSPNSVSAEPKAIIMPAEAESPNDEPNVNKGSGGGFNDIIYKIEDTPPWYYTMLLALQVLHILHLLHSHLPV